MLAALDGALMALIVCRGTSVTTLTDSNFKSQVTNSKDLWMVKVGAF
jgi:hypothetical protein